jgi:hypothetical protein
MATIDWDDPCARAKTLREARYRLISGLQEYQFDFKSNDVERHLTFSRGDLGRLEAEIRIAEEACALAGGAPVTTRRRALVAGSRSGSPW